MRKFLLLFVLAIMAVPAMMANTVSFYFQDGEEDGFEIDNPQTLVSIFNTTTESPVSVPEDVAFMTFNFNEATTLKIYPADFDYELVVNCTDGDEDNFSLEKEENEWFLTLLEEADDLEFTVKVYQEGTAPGQGATNVTVNFTVESAENSEIANLDESVIISYFDKATFQNVTLSLDAAFASASVAAGTSFDIKPAEGYVVSDVVTYLSGIVSISQPGNDNTWNVYVNDNPDGDFISLTITVDNADNNGPGQDETAATISQIEQLKWKVEWEAFDYISKTDTDYQENNAFLTDSENQVTMLYADIHGDNPNPEIIFPSESGNYFTIDLTNLSLQNGLYSLTIPEGYVELGSSRTPSPVQFFEIEIGGTFQPTYTVQIAEIQGNTIDISWDNVTSLSPGTTEGAYMRNIQSSEEYPLEYLKDEMYSKCNLRIYNSSILRVNVTNNYPNLPTGTYELYIPADYVKFNGTEIGNESIDGHFFYYTAPWSEGEIEFNALIEENKLTFTWIDASEIAYNTEYAGDGNGINGVTIFTDGDYYLNLDYGEDFTISGNTLTIDITGLPLSGECNVVIPEDCLLITVDGITNYTDGTSGKFKYSDNDNKGYPLYSESATWSHLNGDTLYSNQFIEITWGEFELAFTENPELCSVHSPETGVLDINYTTNVKLSDDKTKILISLKTIPEGTYRVNVPEGCVYFTVNGTTYANSGTSMDGIIVSSEAGLKSIEVGGGRYRVVDLTGIVVLDTDNASDIENLPRGFYIVNGKKLVK